MYKLHRNITNYLVGELWALLTLMPVIFTHCCVVHVYVYLCIVVDVCDCLCMLLTYMRVELMESADYSSDSGSGPRLEMSPPPHDLTTLTG